MAALQKRAVGIPALFLLSTDYTLHLKKLNVIWCLRIDITTDAQQLKQTKRRILQKKRSDRSQK